MAISVPYEELDSLFPLLPFKTVPGAKSIETNTPRRKYSELQDLSVASMADEDISIPVNTIRILLTTNEFNG